MNVQDRRRLLGPGNAKPITFEPIVKEKDKQEATEHDIKETLFLRSGLIENCNGSSLVEFKSQHRQTSLIASVYGPRAVRGSFTSKAAISVQIKNGSSGDYDKSRLKELASFLTTVFSSVINRSRYPKSGIDIFIHLTYDRDLQDEKNAGIAAIIPHCITGITLALIDAGIEVLDITSGGHHNGSVFAFIKEGEEVTGFWKDPSRCDDNMEESLKVCKERYLNYKSIMTGYLFQNQKSESVQEA
ncbi:hypothetical protein HG535_0B05730 [Zygotorulaspora mrakii]|uniref:Exoribonuclease phosphorolytic domain-containing protein n=1 Tax=Zygotorulaspora mrakii TaxID=42260 RepID=A0A7H9AYP9_ZYGMR|nr:uncharacterized protein HG535_0B05730 [Zygotorulaspora mrakii]QLG71530.1 hypothetical protein HG535_0B05730 [Zygotorulaspora mrakii]